MVDPNPLLIRVGTPILFASKVDAEATEGQGRAELGNVKALGSKSLWGRGSEEPALGVTAATS